MSIEAHAVTGHRSMVTVKKPTRRRHCRCAQPVTHVGMADGVAMMDGCVWCVRRWVRDPLAPGVDR